MKAKLHYTHPYLLNPQHKITVHLIGVGGTGSQVLSGLARIHTALIALGHTGLHVRAYDPDVVTDANIGRQMFSPSDLGANKALAATSRVNRFFGLSWEAHPKRFNGIDDKCNIYITCVDTAAGRVEIGNSIKTVYAGMDSEPHNKSIYWLDFGNSVTTGQVVLGTVFTSGYNAKNNHLKPVNELFDLHSINEEDQGPSCSLAEALGRQDLFINSTLANLGCNILWKLFRFGKISHHGVYLNLDTLKSTSIPV